MGFREGAVVGAKQAWGLSKLEISDAHGMDISVVYRPPSQVSGVCTSNECGRVDLQSCRVCEHSVDL